MDTGIMVALLHEEGNRSIDLASLNYFLKLLNFTIYFFTDFTDHFT